MSDPTARGSLVLIERDSRERRERGDDIKQKDIEPMTSQKWESASMHGKQPTRSAIGAHYQKNTLFLC